ncbi:unnamed protein product [Hermetia illucens]|uniref:Sensory neuron membrane protein 1 n=2 Tax=Hermetia illucens TaxID=343691 RepID=A0A7R8YW18_HERIL|nr:unnamed protein product [Hermetia illucens]
MNINFRRLAITGGVLFIFGILVGWIIFPKILKSMIKKQINLKQGSDIREMWTKVPFPLDFLIYVFNVTNPEDVTMGRTPVVNEIGPYYFEEWKDKYDLEDDEEEDSITYHMRNTFIFRADKSNGLTGEEMITLPHLLVQGMSIVVKRERAPMLSLVSKAIKEMFPIKMPFFTAPFLDIFFRGIPVDCSSQDFAVKGVCTAFHTGEVKGAKLVNETHFAFSVFGGANASDAGKFTVLRGLKNISDLGRVIRFEDEPELDIWNGDDCNQFIGTDSTIFPPFMAKEQGLWAFAADLCRSFGALYERKSKYAGIPTMRYIMNLGDIRADEKLHCFCNDPPDGCPLKGTMDLFPCTGAPLMASMPHFFNGDERLFRDVVGLNPNKHDHEAFIDFELMTGSPLSAAKRLQFNLDMEPVGEVEVMKNVPRLIMPLFWVQEGVSLNKTFTNQLKYSLFLGLKINFVFKWIFTTIGLILSIASGYLYQKKSQTVSITEVMKSPPPVTKDVQQNGKASAKSLESVSDKF